MLIFPSSCKIFGGSWHNTIEGGEDPPLAQASESNSIDSISQCIIPQLDGNISLSSQSIFSDHLCSCCDLPDSSSVCHQDFGQPIATHLGHRPGKSQVSRLPPVRIRIRRDNRTIQALALPKVLNYNMRSLFSKIGNFS